MTLERVSTYIIEIVHALQAQASLPLTFWYEACATVVHLINQLATPILASKSPC